MKAFYGMPLRAAFLSIFLFAISGGLFAQSANSTAVEGTVLDPSGAVVPNATVEIRNPVSQFD
ncbi:MAG TPA: carboxypeptidase-like regulatory domain-containing protein, partial [Terriglobales bacterium]|nr:carboxypeptidase-like regulatory domain-containing protein [Terriglobales bacterium]